jgi:hypothetical protein
MPPIFVLTFDNPQLRAFNQEISLGSESRPWLRTARIKNTHEKYYAVWHSIYGDTLGGQFVHIQTWLDLWTSEKTTDQQRALAQWLKAQQSPNSPEEISLVAWLSTRAIRWQKLAKHLGIAVPDAFCVYRFAKLWRKGEFSGDKTILPKVFEVIQKVVDTWISGSDQPFEARQKELGSWSLSISGLQKHIEMAKIGLIYKTELPFDLTIADKWVDDDAFVEFSSENEIIALTPVNVLLRDIAIVIDGYIFNFEQISPLVVCCVQKYGFQLRV